MPGRIRQIRDIFNLKIFSSEIRAKISYHKKLKMLLTGISVDSCLYYQNATRLAPNKLKVLKSLYLCIRSKFTVVVINEYSS